MEQQSVEETITEALVEAQILEGALEKFDKEHMLYTAMKLSGAPYNLIEEVYKKSKSF